MAGYCPVPVDDGDDGEYVLDLGLLSTLHRVKAWLHEYDRMDGLGGVVHTANGHELRTADLSRLLDRLDQLPEVNCAPGHEHPASESP